MRGSKYATGVLMTLIGGSGLAEISTSNHGSFILCAALFGIGFFICASELVKGE